MNETRDILKLLERWGHLPLAELPAEVREQVLANPAGRAAFDRNDRLVALLQLKRHELPDPAYEGRLLHRVRTRLDNQAGLDPVDPSELSPVESRPWSWSWIAPLGIAAALAVAFVPRLFSPAGSPGPAVAAAPPAPSAPDPVVVVAPPAAPAGVGLTDAQVRRIFAVEKTTNNLRRLISDNHLENYELVDVSTNRPGAVAADPAQGSPLVPVKAPVPQP